MIFKIKIDQEKTIDNPNDIKDYLDNCLRHIADDWEISLENKSNMNCGC